MPFTKTYLVVEPMRPIAADLGYAIQDLDPKGRIILAASDSEAMERMGGMTAVHLAIVHAGPAAHRASRLGRLLAAMSTVCILIGDSAEAALPSQDLAVLHRPYSPDSVREALRAVMRFPGSAPGKP